MGVGPACRTSHPLAFPSGSWTTFHTHGTVSYRQALAFPQGYIEALGPTSPVSSLQWAQEQQGLGQVPFLGSVLDPTAQ